MDTFTTGKVEHTRVSLIVIASTAEERIASSWKVRVDRYSLIPSFTFYLEDNCLFIIIIIEITIKLRKIGKVANLIYEN